MNPYPIALSLSIMLYYLNLNMGENEAGGKCKLYVNENYSYWLAMTYNL